MDRQHFRSLKTRILLLLIILELIFAVLLSYNNYSALSVIKKRIYENTKSTLVMYQKQLDDLMKHTETYLYTLAMIDSNVQKLIFSEEEDASWYILLQHLKTSLTGSLSLYAVDGIFCYFPSHDCYLPVTTDANAYQIRARILPEMKDGSTDISDWQLIQCADAFYFCRILHLNEIYVGTWVSMERLLDTLVNEEKFSSGLYLSPDDHTILVNGEMPRTLDMWKKEGYVYTRIDGTEMLLVTKNLENSPFTLKMFVPTSEFKAENQTLVNVVLFVFLSFLTFWLLTVLLVNRWILRPMRKLTDAIRALRNGNMDISIPETAGYPSEFLLAHSAFNEMVAQIKHLTIENYEKKLQKQRLEALYLKQQVSPHFMINCLNTVYQLATPKRLELARSMLKAFSNHLRYTLSSGAIVSLGEELNFVNNYIELSNIRYPNRIRLFADCPEGLYNAAAIPLLLLNFVENTIKYEVSMDQILDIHIRIKALAEQTPPRMHLCIWDTGGGFSQDMLQRLKDPEEYAKTETEHIGIVNVILRAQYTYEYSRFAFTNKADAGAQIDMEISLIPYQKEG